jgi:TolA-binding protein
VPSIGTTPNAHVNNWRDFSRPPRYWAVMLDDFGGELEEIRREIVENRSLSIKTNNLVNALAADVNSIAKRQQNYERSLRWNSAAAYVVTAVVLMLVGKIVVDARVETVRASTNEQSERLTQLEKEAADLRTRSDDLQKDQKRAFDFYQLVQQKKYAEVLKAYDDLADAKLTKTEESVFKTARDVASNELSIERYEEGLDHIRTQRWHEAEQALSAALRYKPDAAHAPNARLQLARALQALGRQREAIPSLIKLFESSPDKEVMDDAAVLLADCQVDIQAYNDAKATLRAFIRRFPTSPFSQDARMKLADLQLHY